MRIEAVNLKFAYGEKTVLDGVSFRLAAGSLCALIGPNGSGKTTLLKILSSVLKPARGRVLLDGRPLGSFAPRELARTLAVVSQGGDAGYLFTVEELVSMGRAPYLGRFQSETASDKEIVRQVLELTGCLYLKDRLVSRLSGGERQRVSIARALAQQPRVLLLDEPTSHLDIGYQREILDLLKQLNMAEGMTVVAVLHDLNLASYFAGTLFLLNKGKIEAAGPPSEVVTAEHIASVYRTGVLVTPHPVLGTPHVFLLPVQRGLNSRKNYRVHVLAGGGSAGELLRDLAEAGYDVSAGVLNVGDSDWEAARALGLPVVEEAPFSPISPARHAENLSLVREAKAVILAEAPVGHGNILNLQAATEALRGNTPLFIMEERPARPRDFTGGEGERLLRALKQNGGRVINEKARLYRALRELNSGDQLNQLQNLPGLTVDQERVV